MLRFLLVIFSLVSLFAFTQEIDAKRIRKHAEILASDSLEGRNTGDLGQKKAAAYLQSEFRKLKMDSLSVGYFQSFLLARQQAEGTLKINGQVLTFPQDFCSFGDIQLHYLKTSSVQHYTYEHLLKLKPSAKDVIIVSAKSIKDVNMEFIRSSGVKIVFLLLEDYNKEYLTSIKSRLTLLTEKNQHLFLVDAKKIPLLKKKNKLSLSVPKDDSKRSENVIAVITGSDSLLKKEVVVVSAHYDHLGIKKGIVYNGADDNASGTSALLELARYFKELEGKGQQPKRSILFICFSGEEHGLLGSKYYSDHPLIPLKQTVADFNIDMIGRKDTLKEKEQLVVYAIGSDKISLDFHYQHENVAKEQNKVILDYTYNEDKHPDRLYYRSDHYNFAKNGVPSVFYFGGFHEDYHQASDDVSKLDFEKIKAITELVAMEIMHFAN